MISTRVTLDWNCPQKFSWSLKNNELSLTLGWSSPWLSNVSSAVRNVKMTNMIKLNNTECNNCCTIQVINAKNFI